MDTEQRCLYCLRGDGGFESREHPIPESIGNTTVIIPPGIVCDRCNGGELSVLDQALADCFPIKIRRTTLGIESKAGKVPVTRFQDGQLINNGQFAALRGEMSPKTWQEEYRSKRDPRYTIGMATLVGGKPMRGKYASQISRAVLKLALGCAWTEIGERLLDPEFDEIREVILGKRPYTSYVLIGREIDERRTDVDVRFHAFRDDTNGRLSLFVHAKIYGVTVITDSRGTALPTGVLELGSIMHFGAQTSP